MERRLLDAKKVQKVGVFLWNDVCNIHSNLAYLLKSCVCFGIFKLGCALF